MTTTAIEIKKHIKKHKGIRFTPNELHRRLEREGFTVGADTVRQKLVDLEAKNVVRRCGGSRSKGFIFESTGVEEIEVAPKDGQEKLYYFLAKTLAIKRWDKDVFRHFGK
jgi:hypothetical protein